MTPLMIVGIAFTAMFSLVLIAIVFINKKFNPVQQTAIIVIEALCAGFASFGFIGNVQLQANGKLEGIDIALSAGGGFALAIVLGFGMSKLLTLLHKREGEGVNGISFAWPANSKFQTIAEKIIQGQQLVAQFDKFTAAQLNTKLTPGKLQANTLEEALIGLATQAKLPKVSVKIQGALCYLVMEGS